MSIKTTSVAATPAHARPTPKKTADPCQAAAGSYVKSDSIGPRFSPPSPGGAGGSTGGLLNAVLHDPCMSPLPPGVAGKLLSSGMGMDGVSGKIGK